MTDAERQAAGGPPSEFLERLARIIPADFLQNTRISLETAPATTVRVNALLTGMAEAREALNTLPLSAPPVFPLLQPGLEPLPLADWVFQVQPEDRQQITHHPLADQGWFYIQNLSSILSVAVLAPQPGESILDLAAAPGGKTTAIAQLMNNQGMLSAVEPIRSRCFKLKANLTRCGVTICKTYPIDGRWVAKKTPRRFDRVLLDAPCSSEARIRWAQPASWAKWSLRKIREQARKQKGLLSAAIQATRPGGRVVYCTCSFAPEENEAVVQQALNKFGDQLELEPIDLPLPNTQPGLSEFGGKEFDPQIKHCLRILPTFQMAGFFMACLKVGE